jgi:hypothetical protein
MSLSRKYNTVAAGVISAILIPVITGIGIWIFSAGNYDLASYFRRIAEAGITTHIVSLCVFPNIILFLIFNRFDMLNASKGVLGMTIIWALIVFLIKFL